MAKQIRISIKETEKELLRLLARQTKLIQSQRVKALLLIKQGKVTYTYELANKLKRERKTIYTWLGLYQKQGMSGYLTIKSRGGPKGLITTEVKEGLKAKLSDSTTTITSYVELVFWVEETYGLKLNYKTLYGHCRKHLKSKLKVSRKSHYKKDKDAEESFKKTA